MNRVGVFLRSTGIEDIAQALSAVRERIGSEVIHLSKLPDRYYTAKGVKEVDEMLRDAGVRADAVTIVHDGESYRDIQSVRETVGYLPPATVEERVEYSFRCADLAAGIGAPVVTTHMGILPKDEKAAGYRRLLDAVTRVAGYCTSRGVNLALETGQETAQEMRTFLDNIEGLDVGINLDPANLVLYGMDDPIRFTEALADRIVGFHAKDGLPPQTSGALGTEVSPGEGAAEVAECVEYLLEYGYSGSFVIENYVNRHGSVDEKIGELVKVKRFLDSIIEAHDARTKKG